jgi:dipeptidyl aminopeptidase/acylaminoacyl peptidase
MLKYLGLLFSVFISATAVSQTKQPLTHAVYDGWKSVGERLISNDGQYTAHTITPQEGDGELVIRQRTGAYNKTISRAYGAVFSNDSRYIVFRIKPAFQDTRQARIKKKRPDEMPKDSLGIVELGKDSVIRIPRIKSFRLPEKGSGWTAWHLEKPLPDTTKKKVVVDSAKLYRETLLKIADSVIRFSIDSVKGKLSREQVLMAAEKATQAIYKTQKDNEPVNPGDAEGDEGPGGGSAAEGTDLILRNLTSSKQLVFKSVSEYAFDKKGNYLLFETTRNPKDSNSRAMVILHRLAAGKNDTIMKGFNDAKLFAFDEAGTQLAFVAERDSSTKALQKFYKLWYYKPGQDSATVLAEKATTGMKLGSTVSDNRTPQFSKNGQQLYFGTSPIRPPKDTTLVDFELARLDVWHYNDDYLQPTQLRRLDNDLKRSYLAVTRPGTQKIIQLADDNAESAVLVDEGNAAWVLGLTSKNNRKSTQWDTDQKMTAFVISTVDGSRKLVKANIAANFQASPSGKYVFWYDLMAKQYFTYELATQQIRNISAGVKEHLYDDEDDHPRVPYAFGDIGWMENDTHYFVNDRYDIWQLDPTGATPPVNLTGGWGKKTRTQLSYSPLDPEERFFKNDQTIVLRSFNRDSKYGGYCKVKINAPGAPVRLYEGPYSFGQLVKAKEAEAYIVSKASIAGSELVQTADLRELEQITNVAQQQKGYNWLTVELVKWKLPDGRISEGLLYKPENFDSTKKYPIIFYYYERNADGLYSYRAPAPSASTVNIPYFASNGYLIFDPNIYYKNGEPGQSAVDAVVSAARFLSKKKWVDSTRMGLQGQSWGGYQTAFIITRTKMFKAASAGAPVANMTSAYGGIRWGTGISRQFQYEKDQSRIGYTLWQRQDLYIKNSPLFAADKITTPLLIMHNDADGAVPWWQGIELFTALKRLDKKAWLLQYNGEDHNLVERRNRKDLSVRLGQFFDHFLKGEKPAKWLKDGVPATDKGIDWGLKVE